MRLRSLAAILAGLALIATPALGWQSQSQQPPPKKEEKKPKKVWTADDLAKLRRPVDKYQAEKEKAEAEAKAAQEKAGPTAEKPAPAAEEKKEPQPGEFIPPKTLEEAEKRLAEKLEEVGFQEEKIRQVRDEFFKETDPALREAKQKELETLQMALEDALKELKLLEEAVARLRPKPGEGTGL